MIAHGGVVSTSQAINWAYGQRIEMNGEIRRNGFNYTVRNALEALGAKRIERQQGKHGRPFVWEWPPADAHVSPTPNQSAVGGDSYT